MNFESLDWDTEAKRLMRAFGCIEKAEFRRKVKVAGEKYILLRGNRNYLVLHDGLHLSAIYKPNALWFKLQNAGVATWITVDCNGQPLQVGENFSYAEPLAKGLFHLGLLSSQVEVALKLAVSSAQKADWMRQLESFNYWSLDWDAEAQRVARAFDLNGPYHFEEKGRGSYRELEQRDGTRHCSIRERDDLKFWCAYSLSSGPSYIISRPDEHIWTDVHLDWSGQICEEVYNYDYSEITAKGLFHLGLLTPEVEAALKVAVSNHQKLEWALEYEARYGL